MMSVPAFRVVHAAENIKGGVGTYLRDLVVAQRASFGEDSVVAVVPQSQSDILGAPAGVEIVTFDDHGPRWRSTLRLAARMRAVMTRSRRARIDSDVASSRRVDASIVHLHSTFAGLALRPLLQRIPRAHRPPVVYCAHGWSFDRETSAMSRRLAMTLERALAPACDAIVCISGHEMQLARRAGIPARRLTHIANGIPFESPPASGAKPAWPDGKRRLLFVGRFDRQKGADIFLEALRELPDTFAYLVGSAVLGDGGLPELPSNVQTTGWLSAQDLTAFYESADALVVPSRWEGFGLTAVEGMRAGLPVIATRVGGLAEVVDHGVTGLLVEPGSSAALVAAIRGTGTGSLRSMGAAGRQRFIEHFTLDRVHAQLTALYQRLCAQKNAAPESRRRAPRTQPESARQPESSPNA